MALAAVKTFLPGEVLYASDLNALNTNILNNPISLVSPWTASMDAGGFDLTALDELALNDAAANASAAGRLRRNSANLTWHDGTAAGRVFYAGGTDIPVGDGGTGLSSGTSGGVLAFTAAATLASSGALTANGFVLGGGAGVAPTATAAPTNGQLPIGNTGNAPSLATLTAGNGISISNAAGSITVAGDFASQAEMEAATSVVDIVSPGIVKYNPGVAKAWIAATGSAGTYTTQISNNISSVTDNGTGDLTFNFSTAFSGIHYVAAGILGDYGAGASPRAFNVSSDAAPTTSAIRLLMLFSGGAEDQARYSLAFFGDQ